MDHAQYSNLMAALGTVPDPRQARGKQLEWPLILGVITSALLSQQRSAAAIAQWAQRHAHMLVTAFRPRHARVPSESTIRRALHRIDVHALEQHLAQFASRATANSSGHFSALQGYAIDGKHLRGAGAHGRPIVLVSMVAHASIQGVAQTAVAHKRHESTAVPGLLTGRNLRGMVLTMDAGLTHTKVAAQILAQGGHYLMVVKRNQHQLYEELT